MEMALTPLTDRILFEDNHLIIINKKAGELTQGDKTGDFTLADLIKEYIKKQKNKPGNVFCGVIHRLDRPASGAVAYARTSKGLARMNELFVSREVKKTYWAIVGAKPPKDQDKLEHYITKREKLNKSYVQEREALGYQKAVLEYKLIASSDRYHLLEIDLHTGRHHQIRAQLAFIGCVIKGDLKYGAPRSNKDGSICLHARHIEFTHPVSNQLISIQAPVPDDALWNWFQQQMQP